jgi:hypothetical protein
MKIRISKKNKNKNKNKLKGGTLRKLFRRTVNYGPSMNHKLTYNQKRELNKTFIPSLEGLTEEEIRLRIEKEKIDSKLKELRVRHSKSNPSIYLQNSHSNHLNVCLKVPKNTLLIFLTVSGEPAIMGVELPLEGSEFQELLKKPINNKTEMDKRLYDLRKVFPDLTFHYSDYFGIKPIGDSKRLKCKYNTTESYYDILYGRHLDPGGLTTLEQYKNETGDSLIISDYHIRQKLEHIGILYKDISFEKIKEAIPYFDVRHPNKGKVFNTTRDLYDYYFKDKDKNLEIKLSKLIEINKPGIYIHHACRPFDSGTNMTEETQKNSLNTITAVASSCPLENEIKMDKGYKNKIIGKYYGCSRLKKVTISKNVEKIDKAFCYCTALIDIIFEEVSKLLHIGDATFIACYSLKKIVIPDSVIHIGKEVFNDCSKLYEVKLPTNLEVLEEKLFINCINLTKIILPKKLKRIKKNAFENNLKLKNIDFPDTLEYIDTNAFSSCKKLETIKLHNSLLELRDGVFSYCEKLHTVILSDNITIIHSNTFNYCDVLTNINMPKKIKEIKEDAFKDCMQLKKLTFPIEIINIIIHKDVFKYLELESVIFYKTTKINDKPAEHPDNKNLFPEKCKIEIIGAIELLDTAINVAGFKNKPKTKKK